ncbi:hypothetical protein SDJN02_10920, partial [Cucurbita argyrosperma subsp. argyrosperma]
MGPCVLKLSTRRKLAASLGNWKLIFYIYPRNGKEDEAVDRGYACYTCKSSSMTSSSVMMPIASPSSVSLASMSSAICRTSESKSLDHFLLPENFRWMEESGRMKLVSASNLSRLALISIAKVSERGVMTSLATFSVSSSAPPIMVVSSRVSSPPFPACTSKKPNSATQERQIVARV